jgi:hypothetical protein
MLSEGVEMGDRHIIATIKSGEFYVAPHHK